MKDKKQKKKIAHVLKSSVYSGAENVVFTIIQELQDEFEFIYVATDGSIRNKLEQEKIPCVLLNKFTRRNLEEVIRRYAPDIVHAHDFTASVMCATLPGRFRLISHLHYDPPWVRNWNKKTIIYWMMSFRIERILAVSEQSYKNMAFEKKLARKHITIGNPVNISRIQKMSNQKLPSQKYDMIFVGRLVEQKNPQRFIELIRQLRDRGRNVKCAVLGTGQLEEECKALIKKYRLDDQIKMLGFQENPYVYMKASKFLCMTSRWEGYGLVVLEANASGIPVLCSQTAGTREILGDKAEELCDTDEEFVEKMELLLFNEEVYREWKKRSERRICNTVQYKNYMAEIEKIYLK